ncbi:MAG: hypothetical protein [Bacteriophage sp.]|nr:MAG: hypothetical protein [Bacteriophage sp.]
MGYYKMLMDAAFEAGLERHEERWTDHARLTTVTKFYFAYRTGDGKSNLIATAKDSHEYPYEFEQEAIKAINTIRQFNSWV